jgi:hypothetical protein
VGRLGFRISGTNFQYLARLWRGINSLVPLQEVRILPARRLCSSLASNALDSDLKIQSTRDPDGHAFPIV